MRKVNKVTLVEKFSKTEEEKHNDEKKYTFVCNGGGSETCRKAYNNNDKKNLSNTSTRITRKNRRY